MKPPNSLSDHHLKDYADEHLQYEFDMLIWSAGIVSTLAISRDHGFLPWALNNAVLNTFSVHARNLISFLYSRSQGKDYSTDVVIEDYIDEQTLAQHLPQITPLLEEAITKASKQVAHLTLERIEYEKGGKEWGFIDVADDILEAFKAIASHFPESRLSEEFRAKFSRPGLIIPSVKTQPLEDSDGYPIGVALLLMRESKKSEE